ncbi:MAG: transposase [Rhodobacteraceae bacterium]|nr:transposase [Paracoccaceae bacterium]
MARSSYCYTPKGETEQNLGVMRQIDEHLRETPFFGVRQMTWHLRDDGPLVNEKRIRRLMFLCRFTRNPRPAGQRRGTRPILTCSEACAWIARTRSGARTSLICRCAGSFTSWRSWTGTPARFCSGGSRTRWKPGSTLTR